MFVMLKFIKVVPYVNGLELAYGHGIDIWKLVVPVLTQEK